MTVTLNGAQFKAFIDDDTYWRDGMWVEDDIVVVDGVEVENVDCDTLGDTQQIKVSEGVVMSDDGFEPMSYEIFIKRWLKKQTVKSVVIQFDISKTDEVMALLKQNGIKVLK